jgi:hypothetical protein
VTVIEPDGHLAGGKTNWDADEGLEFHALRD